MKYFGVVIFFAFIVSPILTTLPFNLTSLIEDNRLEEAREKTMVPPDLFLNVTSFSGLLSVDKRYNSHLFFWYLPVKNKVLLKETPWIIWLQGGPGGTSLFGLFEEMGPFTYDSELKFRETSWWNAGYSMVFIDNPVGAGFSFTENDKGYPRNMETYSKNLYDAVKQLTKLYPELSEAPLYIAGESYAGRYVPSLGIKIMQGNDNQSNGNINLKGLIMGNPVLDREDIADFITIYYHWGLLDAQGAAAARPFQDKFMQAVKDGDVDASNKLYDDLFTALDRLTSKPVSYNILKKSAPSRNFVYFITRSDVRKALHVGDITFDFLNSKTNMILRSDFITPVSPMLEVLLENYRVLIYCGQLDSVAPCVTNAEARRRKWRWSGRQRFLSAPRVPWGHQDFDAGYIKSGGNFTEVLVTGAGHMAPIDKPAQVQDLIDAFIQNKELPRPQSFVDKLKSVIPNYDDYKYASYSEYSPKTDSSGISASLVTSFVINAVLIAALIIGVIMFIRWKRQNDFFYSPLSDGVLTMT